MSSTRLTSHDEMSPLKALALVNIPFISVTLDVFQLSRFWLNDVALRNMFIIFCAFETSQELMSQLKDVAKVNMYAKFSPELTSLGSGKTGNGKAGSGRTGGGVRCLVTTTQATEK